MAEIYEGNPAAAGLKFAVVVARFNEFISKQLLSGSLDALRRHGVSEEDVDIAWTPGAFEIPLIAKKMAEKGRYDAVICLGAVIRGGTPHFEYVCNAAATGIAAVSMETGVPALFGIITADTVEQAIERSGNKAENKGWQASVAAIEMANLNRMIEGKK